MPTLGDSVYSKFVGENLGFLQKKVHADACSSFFFENFASNNFSNETSHSNLLIEQN